MIVGELTYGMLRARIHELPLGIRNVDVRMYGCGGGLRKGLGELQLSPYSTQPLSTLICTRRGANHGWGNAEGSSSKWRYFELSRVSIIANEYHQATNRKQITSKPLPTIYLGDRDPTRPAGITSNSNPC